MESEGIHKLLYSSITSCDVDIERELRKNIIMAGGNSMFQGFDARLTKEVKALDETMGIKVWDSPEMKYSAWIGGSILSVINTNMVTFIDKDEYDESGPGIVNRRCF